MRWTMVVMTVALTFTLLVPEVAADDKSKAKIDRSKIYYGNPSKFETPAVVNVQEVYLQIEEYKKIVDRNMDPSDPKYMMLLKAASRKFRKAVRAAAEQGGYDLVGARGSIEIKGQVVPEITQDVIANLP